jgi:hypothetical protein
MVSLETRVLFVEDGPLDEECPLVSHYGFLVHEQVVWGARQGPCAPAQFLKEKSIRDLWQLDVTPQSTCCQLQWLILP